MKSFTITFENDAHCEAVARRRGWTDEVRNPKFMTDPSKNQEMIDNPEAHEEYLGRITREELKADLVTIAKETAATEAQATIDTKVNKFLGADEVKSKSHRSKS